MKIYRGPSSKPFRYIRHEPVSRVSGEELEKSIRSNSSIRFNITKAAGIERQSVCTAFFEDSDLIPMISGLLSRLKSNQDGLSRIRRAIDNATMSDTKKIAAVRAILKWAIKGTA